MDESLQLLPVVETLDVSRNRLAKVNNLQKCLKLKHLDLGFNHLRTVALFSQVGCPIVRLVLRNNALTSLSGIENLKLLQELDLSCNIISSFSELEILASLSCLESVWFKGNPVYFARCYRAHVFSVFPHPDKLKLDNKGINRRECWERHFILASRQKRPAGYGFYFPAKDLIDDEQSAIIRRKKNCRLACIENDEMTTYLCSDSAERESPSFDSDTLKNDECVVSDGDSDVVSLINRVEFMKKEKSYLWLRDFKEWMDVHSWDVVDRGKHTSFDTSMREKNKELIDDKKYRGESSRNTNEVVQFSDCGSGSNTPDCNISFTDGHTVHSELFGSGRRALAPHSMTGSQTDYGHVEQVAEQGSPEFHLKAVDVSPHLNGPPQITSAVEGEVPLSTQITAIDKILGSQSSDKYTGLPPQYCQDILHRRLDLEEKFLQLSVESHSLVSSDSDSSCSSDGSCKHELPSIEPDRIFNEDTRRNDQPVTTLSYVDHEALGIETCPDDGKTFLPYSLQTSSKIVSCNDNSLSKNINSNGDCCLVDPCEVLDALNSDRKRSKGKPKKRLICLSDCDTELNFRKPNGILEVQENNVARNDKLISNENITEKSREGDANFSQKVEAGKLLMESSHDPILNTKTSTLIPHTDKIAKDSFDENSADSSTCEG